MDAPLLIELEDLAQREAWIPLCALLIGVLVRLLKSPRVPGWLGNIPHKMRPMLAVVLGVLSSGLDRVAHGTPWRTALISGLLSAAVAVLAHDVVVEGLRGGREFGHLPGDKP